MAKRELTALEARALEDPDVRFGFDNYEVLRSLGEFVREMRGSEMSQSSLQALSGIPQADISRIESGSMERGPTLLTLVRLARATGKQLVLGLRDVKEVEEDRAADHGVTQLTSF